MLASVLLPDSGVHLPCQDVVSRLHTTVPEIERYVKGQRRIGDYLYKTYTGHVSKHYAWSKELWDSAVIAYLLAPD